MPSLFSVFVAVYIIGLYDYVMDNMNGYGRDNSQGGYEYPQGYGQPVQQPVQFVPYIPAPVVMVHEPRPLSIVSFFVGLASVVFGLLIVVPLIGVVLSVLGLMRERSGVVWAVLGLLLSGGSLAVWGSILGLLVNGAMRSAGGA